MESLLKYLDPQLSVVMVVAYLMLDRYLTRRSQDEKMTEVVARLRRIDHQADSIQRGLNRQLRSAGLEEEGWQ